MNKIFMLGAVLLCGHASLVKADSEPVIDPIVTTGKAVEFGIWRVYNSGTTIYIVDKEDMHYLQVDTSTNDPTFDVKTKRWLLHSAGTAGEMPAIAASHPYTQDASNALKVASSGHLAAGRYGFGAKRFVVSDNSITVFNSKDETTLGNAVPSIVLKNYTNELTHTGTKTSTYIDPSKVLANDNSVNSPVVVGDCLATYSPSTGQVSIPCLKMDGDSTIYRIKQQQIPNTLKFEADLNSLQRVQ